MSEKILKSTNPLKRPVVRVLKELSGGDRITQVRESEVGFSGNAHKSLGNRRYEALGRVEVSKSQLAEMGLLPLVSSTTVSESESVPSSVSPVASEGSSSSVTSSLVD